MSKNTTLFKKQSWLGLTLWWNLGGDFNPFEKYARQIESSPQV